MKNNSLIVELAEVIARHWPGRDHVLRRLARALVPHPGTLIVTLLVVAGLLWANSVGALPLRAPTAASTSTGTIAYQGRLADADGNPLTDTYNMIFRLYDVASGGVFLWEEQWTGSNGVQVSDGLFNVMLGSLTPIPQSVITEHDSLFLGITVGTDDEMTPRVQLGTVPFAVQALTVPDGSVTTGKLADSVITSPKIQDGQVGTVDLADNAITSSKIQDGAVTQAKAPTLARAKSRGGDEVKIEVFTVTCNSGGGCDYSFTVGFSETPMILKSAFDHLDISDYGPNPTSHEALHAVSQPNSTHTLMAIGR